ncbi:MAG: peptidylprolyl isomerase [Verrucomicrobia bacterium]|nr:peptidylprolyl isomerase [Verrucomicrobiota bacterium]
MPYKRPQPTYATIHFAACAGALLLLCSACGKKDDVTPVGSETPPAQNPGVSVSEGSGSAPSADAPGSVSPVAATVNGVSLQREELNMRVANALSNPQYAQLPPQTRQMLAKRMEDDMIQNFVTRVLLKTEAERAAVDVAESNVVAAISQIENGIPEGRTLQEMLAQSGTTMEQFRERLVEDIRIRELLSGKMDSLPKATDTEVEAYYAENPDEFTSGESMTARHILIKVEPDADAETKAAKRKIADGHREALLGGKDFAELAMEASEGPSGPQGGALGTFGRGQMVKPFEDAAFAQEIDAIGEIVETRFGYHIIQVQKRDDAGVRSLDEARTEIEAKLNSDRQQETFAGFIEELRAKADITIAEAPGGLPAAGLEGSGLEGPGR